MPTRKLWPVLNPQHIEHHAYAVTLPGDAPLSDTMNEPYRSTLILLEDGRVLGPAHSLHIEIQEIGNGRFSHWDNQIMFSTSDNTDPRTNLRGYHAFSEHNYDIDLSAQKGYAPNQQLFRIGSFSAGAGLDFWATLPTPIMTGDTNENPERSGLQLLEDGVPIGPAHSLHSEIIHKGCGRYSHWHGQLLFSTSDNSDPRHNGRNYHVLVPSVRAGRSSAVLPRKTENLALEHQRLPGPDFGDLAREYTAQLAPEILIITAPTARPKVALIIDWDDWAFASIARQVIKQTYVSFDYTVIPTGCIEIPGQVFLMCEECDLIHFFFRPQILWLQSEDALRFCRSLGISLDTFTTRYVTNKAITTGIYDHLFIDDNSVDEYRHLFTNTITSYYVSSQKLFGIYDRLTDFKKPDSIVTDGVDLEAFVPRNVGRLRTGDERELVVGWVGNSAWRSDLNDPKGVHTILLPAIRSINQHKTLIRPHFADRNSNYVPRTEMPAYYAEIDVLVCSSMIEGTPNPVLEAMACGVPIISTDVGVVAEVFGPLQKNFMLVERSIECMTEALNKLLHDRTLLPQLSSENIKAIQSWAWQKKAAEFEPFFARALAKFRAKADSGQQD